MAAAPFTGEELTRIVAGLRDVFENQLGFPVLRLDRGDYFERVNARVAVLPGTPANLASFLACVGFYMRLLMNKAYQ